LRREVLEGRAAVDGSDAEAVLRSIERGEWNAIKVDMKRFTLGNPGARYDRLTLGSCIQNLDSCSGEPPPGLQICLDKMVSSLLRQLRPPAGSRRVHAARRRV
jgi:hypothetical protein